MGLTVSQTQELGMKLKRFAVYNRTTHTPPRFLSRMNSSLSFRLSGDRGGRCTKRNLKKREMRAIFFMGPRHARASSPSRRRGVELASLSRPRRVRFRVYISSRYFYLSAESRVACWRTLVGALEGALYGPLCDSNRREKRE